MISYLFITPFLIQNANNFRKLYLYFFIMFSHVYYFEKNITNHAYNLYLYL